MTEVHAYKFSNALVRKGFERVESKHHTMFYLAVGGTRTGIRTRISHAIPHTAARARAALAG